VRNGSQKVREISGRRGMIVFGEFNIEWTGLLLVLLEVLLRLVCRVNIVFLFRIYFVFYLLCGN
jgi:hypothetical protein